MMAANYRDFYHDSGMQVTITDCSELAQGPPGHIKASLRCQPNVKPIIQPLGQRRPNSYPKHVVVCQPFRIHGYLISHHSDWNVCKVACDVVMRIE